MSNLDTEKTYITRQNSGFNPTDDFVDVNKMVPIGSAFYAKWKTFSSRVTHKEAASGTRNTRGGQQITPVAKHGTILPFYRNTWVVAVQEGKED